MESFIKSCDFENVLKIIDKSGGPVEAGNGLRQCYRRTQLYDTDCYHDVRGSE